MKTIHVLLGFHSHEPFWELEHHFMNNVGADVSYDYYPVTNYFLKNFPESGPLHDYLLNMAYDLNIPVWLDASNEMYEQLATYRPQAYTRLIEGFQSGFVHSVLTHAHHVHTSLATPFEHIQEIESNQTFLKNRMHLSRPHHEGVFSPEASYRNDMLKTYRQNGIDYVIFPNVESRGTPYTVREHVTDLEYFPYWITDEDGNYVLALPVNTNISEKIWQALETGGLDVIQTQSEHAYDHQAAIDHYKNLIYEECAQAPDGGLLLYASDFEFMGLAHAALPLIHETWRQIYEENRYDIRMWDPSSYVETMSQEHLSTISFDRVSWGPAHAPVFRFDGFYPSIDSPEATLYESYPFIFWRTGTIFTHLVTYLYEYFLESPPTLKPERHTALPPRRFRELPSEEQLALHNLLLKRACNWGWIVTEDRGRWIYVHLYEIMRLVEEHTSSPHASFDARGQEIVDSWRELLRFDLSRRLEHTHHAVEQTYLDTDTSLDNAHAMHLFSLIQEARTLAYEALDILSSHLGADNVPLSSLQQVSLTLSQLLDKLTRVYDVNQPYVERLAAHKNGHIYFEKPQLPDFLQRLDSPYL